ncbi:MAG: hypothetical protein EZS28_016631 [Streblomastix strix]|uniref:Uncharacterized protein n=1 Tax=Streblomastix strix TaxID=222440 RepID=A0A5J4W002_9EUKA|nr:MAG: hypothetical protein EZS28_016631 [Streblomastix strix]
MRIAKRRSSSPFHSTSPPFSQQYINSSSQSSSSSDVIQIVDQSFKDALSKFGLNDNDKQINEGKEEGKE